MASKTAFTSGEWETLQWAVTDTMAYLSMADPGFWDTFKEASGAARFIAAAKAAGDSVLVRDLASDVKMGRDKAVSGSPADVSGAVVTRVSEAIDLVAGKAPEDLEAFKGFILGVAKATAEAVKGIGPNEAAALRKLEELLA